MLELLGSNESAVSIPVELPSTIHPKTGMSRGTEQIVKGNALTERQAQVLEVVRRHLRVRGVPPSRTELARELGLKRQSSVDNQLNALQKKGWVRLLPNVERGIQLLREGAPVLDPDQLPEVRAGTPIVAEEQPPPRLHDYESLVNEFEARPDYYLRVQGDSLDRAGFRTGDVVAVKRNPDVRDGDLVVARIGQEITLKRFRRINDGCVELQPESTNAEHRTIRIDAQTEDVEIVGVVVGAIVGTTSRQSQS